MPEVLPVVRITSILLLFFLSLCSLANNSNWQTELPLWAVEQESAARTVLGKNYFPVDQQYLGEAIAILENDQITAISGKLAKQYVGSGYSKSLPQLKPYLIRSVYKHENQSEYSIFLHRGDLLIMNSSIGPQIIDTKQPLVIYLPEKPLKIYIVAWAF